MEKALFSISCTTCQTRLAVRSEAAIGQILECPKCQSMVHVLPPPGWTPTPAAAAEPAPHGPPPLDRVAAEPANLTLETPDASSRLPRPWLIALGVGIVATVCVVVWLLLWLLTPAPTADSVADEPGEQPAVAKKTIEEPPAAAKPAADIPKKTATDTPKATPPKPAPEKSASPTTPAKKPEPTPVVPEKPAAKDAPKETKTETKKEEKPKDEAADVAQKSEAPEIKKTPPAEVDVAARMADPVRGLQLTDVPLVRAFELLASISTLPITLDPDAFRQLGVTPRDRVTVQLDSTTVEQALEAVASQRGLAVTNDNGQIVITAPPDSRETLKTIPYTVSDLTGNDKAAVAELISLVQAFVSPDAWQLAGGRGTIKPGQDAIVIKQTGAVHQQVLVFCEKLRKARGKPLRSRDAPERFTLTTRTAQARKMLDKPVSANFFQQTPLVKILGFLANATGSDILIDRAAMAKAETSDRVETSLTVETKPLEIVLTDLLGPLGLGYRVVGPNSIQVTTKEAVDERLELEFYPVGPQIERASDKQAAKLIQRLKAEVAPSTWADAGGPGEVYFDAPSQCLIVLQSQPAQAAIERLLATKRE